MEINPSPALPSIDESALTAVVRQAMHGNDVRIADWRVRQIGGGAGNPVSLGLYRIAGTGQDQQGQIEWSIILKIIQSPANAGWENMGEGADQAHWNFWKRELFIYQSGLLETLPEGMAAPQCFGTLELPGEVAWLWLEDIVDSYQGDWPLERYARAARHLGRMNGLYLSGRPLPDFPWFSLQRFRQWGTVAPDWKNFPWNHPRILEYYPRPEENSLRRMFLEYDRFLARLDLLPKTICHGDTYPTNLKSRNSSDGTEQTVALDWALAGIEPIGDDLGQLVFGALMNVKGAKLEDVDPLLFEGYLDGLRDSGCWIDPVQVRFGYAASAALRVGSFRLHFINEDLKQGEIVEEQTKEQTAMTESFEVMMADHAYDLLEAIQ